MITDIRRRHDLTSLHLHVKAHRGSNNGKDYDQFYHHFDLECLDNDDGDAFKQVQFNSYLLLEDVDQRFVAGDSDDV
jgi:hypothetical protein